MINFILGISITLNLGFITAVLMILNLRDKEIEEEAIIDKKLYEEFFNDKKTNKK